MIIIVDIDDTLADAQPRIKEAGPCPETTDTSKIQMWLDQLQPIDKLLSDRPFPAMLKMLQALTSTGHVELIYLTGRSERYRLVTEAWLKMHSFPEGRLHMRGNTEYNSAREYKERYAAAIANSYPNRPKLVIDDDLDGDCSEMYRKYGLYHLKAMGDRL